MFVHPYEKKNVSIQWNVFYVKCETKIKRNWKFQNWGLKSKIKYNITCYIYGDSKITSFLTAVPRLVMVWFELFYFFCVN